MFVHCTFLGALFWRSFLELRCCLYWWCYRCDESMIAPIGLYFIFPLSFVAQLYALLMSRLALVIMLL
jgi:hypothetical protein